MLVKPDDLTDVQRKEFDKLGGCYQKAFLFVMNEGFTSSRRIFVATLLPSEALKVIDNSISRVVLKTMGG